MKLLAIMVLLVAFGQSVFAAVTPEKVCSEKTTVCASYETEIPFATKQEGRFKLVLESLDGKEVSLVKADLWMQMGSHGHGSSPLKITPVAPQEFDVTKAFFVMKGQWLIRVTYLQEGFQETLVFPVMITK